MVTIKISDLVFSINPSELFFKSKSETVNFNIINFGYITKPQKVQPYIIKIDSFFSDNTYSFKNNNTLSASQCIDYLENIFINRMVVDFSITGNKKPRVMKVFIESFSYGEVALSDGDIYFSLVLSEFIKSDVKTGQIFVYENTPPIGNNNNVINNGGFIQYTVKKGDNLWNISRKYLGSGIRYKEIARINGIKNPRLIYPGQVIKIPC